MRPRKPSPAMLVALLALFIALGGSSYAISQISGRQLKNRSVPAKKLKLNSLTGKEIRESRLGLVRRAMRAASADRAATAGNADTVDGADAAALRPSCPGDTMLFGGLCIELVARAATQWGLAWETCVNAGRALISPGPLSAFRGARTDDASAPEWTDHYWTDVDIDWAITILHNGLAGQASITSSAPFRCAAVPVE